MLRMQRNIYRVNTGSLFVAASHQTGLDTRSKARRPIKVGIKGRGKLGTSWDSNPAGLCCSSAHLMQREPDEPSSFTNPNVGPGMYAGFWLKLGSKQALDTRISLHKSNIKITENWKLNVFKHHHECNQGEFKIISTYQTNDYMLLQIKGKKNYR